MMALPPGIVVGPGKVRLWWTRVLDWLEWRIAPQAVISRQKMAEKQARLTQLEELIDRLFP